jgi:hypothetical protein
MSATAGATPGAKAAAPGKWDVFAGVWKRAEEALASVYDSVTFEDLVEEDRRRRTGYVADYTI